VLNIRWLERVDEENRPIVFDPHGTQQTVPLKATLPRRVPECESTSANRRVLTANDEDEHIEMCRAVLEEKPTYGMLRHLQHQKCTQRAGGAASEAPAATAARGLGVAGAQVHQQPFAGPLMSPPAQDVRRGPPRGARALAGREGAVL
jgi:hypothetical protein